MDLLLVLEQTRPVLLAEILLPQHEFHVSRGVVRLGVFDVNLAEKLELDVIGCLFRLRFAGEGQGSRLQVDFGGFGGHIRGGDCERDVVAFGIVGGGALGPEDC